MQKNLESLGIKSKEARENGNKTGTEIGEIQKNMEKMEEIGRSWEI